MRRSTTLWGLSKALGAFNDICAAFWEWIRLRAETAAPPTSLAARTVKADTATPTQRLTEWSDGPPGQQRHPPDLSGMRIAGRWGHLQRRLCALQRRRKRRLRCLKQQCRSPYGYSALTSQGKALKHTCLSAKSDRDTLRLYCCSTWMRPPPCLS
ncbi:Hypothetical predicted protein [Pelobates cultripes]|uniref:Uncharacterized protein n=1 Tax=Pelobates cultripes TaxID=61616 RepID=A0AAD1WR68_PELCU|nr:Hypothetical predicted protein [Pelobates cultripes]